MISGRPAGAGNPAAVAVEAAESDSDMCAPFHRLKVVLRILPPGRDARATARTAEDAATATATAEGGVAGSDQRAVPGNCAPAGIAGS